MLGVLACAFAIGGIAVWQVPRTISDDESHASGATVAQADRAKPAPHTHSPEANGGTENSQQTRLPDLEAERTGIPALKMPSPATTKHKVGNESTPEVLNSSRSAASNARSSAATPAENGLKLFFEAYEVDPTTRDRLVQATVIHRQEDIDIKKAAGYGGWNNPEVSKSRDESYHRFEQEVLATLGPETGGYFIDLSSATMFLPVADDLSARCAARGEPIDAYTKGAIAINLSQNLTNPDYPQPKVLMPNGVEIHEHQALESAEKVLTAHQLELFKELWNEHPYPKP
jgi:hypothetical protein